MNAAMRWQSALSSKRRDLVVSRIFRPWLSCFISKPLSMVWGLRSGQEIAPFHNVQKY